GILMSAPFVVPYSSGNRLSKTPSVTSRLFVVAGVFVGFRNASLSLSRLITTTVLPPFHPWGQSFSGSVPGTVSNDSGVVPPMAPVTATNLGTGYLPKWPPHDTSSFESSVPGRRTGSASAAAASTDSEGHGERLLRNWSGT